MSKFKLSVFGPLAIVNDLDEGVSVTNNAEKVIAAVLDAAPHVKRIIAMDADREPSELVIDGLEFVGFMTVTTRTYTV